MFSTTEKGHDASYDTAVLLIMHKPDTYTGAHADAGGNIDAVKH